jgi:acyl carrier protein
MDEVRDRVLKCFSAVLPHVPANLIPEATQETVSDWDSIAAITLVNVIEDEFEFTVDFDLLAELNSFDRVLLYVRNQVSRLNA